MANAHTLFILSQEAAHYAALIAQHHLQNLTIRACETIAGARPYIDQCHIILAEPALLAPLLPEARQVRWVQSTFAGVDALLQTSFKETCVLTGVKEVFGPLMSEYVFAYLLAFERHLFETYAQQQQKLWRPLAYNSLQGKLLGICGVGSIGSHLATTARHFGMRVWGYSRSPKQIPGLERLFTPSEFHEFLTAPDYLVLTLPLTPETTHLFDDEAFAQINPSALLINVGRGKLVAEPALCRALRQQRLRGAILDVFEDEPLPTQSPLWTLPNVLITPHNAAFSFPEDIVAIFLANYHRFLAHQPLKYVIDVRRGY